MFDLVGCNLLLSPVTVRIPSAGIVQSAKLDLLLKFCHVEGRHSDTLAFANDLSLYGIE